MQWTCPQCCLYPKIKKLMSWLVDTVTFLYIQINEIVMLGEVKLVLFVVSNHLFFFTRQFTWTSNFPFFKKKIKFLIFLSAGLFYFFFCEDKLMKNLGSWRYWTQIFTYTILFSKWWNSNIYGLWRWTFNL